MSNLTEEQRTFLEECLKEFSDRYTDCDSEYQEVYDDGIPTPPIVFPWYTRSRFGYRDRRNRSPDRHNYNRGTKRPRSPDRHHFNRDQDYYQGRNSYQKKSRPSE